MEDHKLQEIVSAAVKKGLAAEAESGRYIDVSRVPLICQAILGIDAKLADIKQNMVTQDQYWPVKTLVYGIVGILLTGLIGSVLLGILQHK